MGSTAAAILRSIVCHMDTLGSEFCLLISRKDIRVSCEHKAPQDKKTDRARDGHGHLLSDWRKLPASGKPSLSESRAGNQTTWKELVHFMQELRPYGPGLGQENGP